jgi:hypothetical protein
VVDPVVAQVAGQLGQRGLGGDHRGVRLLAQPGHQRVDQPDVTLLDVDEDVAVRDDLALDRVERPDRVDLRPGALEVGDDAPELIQV